MAVSFVQGLVRTLIKSLGLKRRLANLFQVLSVVSFTVPVLIPFAPLLQGIASWLGLAGVSHAAVAASSFKLDIHTIAAFFSALILAAKDVPSLQPFQALIIAVAGVLSALSTTQFLSRK